MKRRIKLTESDLHNIIKKSVNTVLNELNVKSQLNENKSFLTESQESKSQSEAVKYIMNNLGWEHDKAYNFVRNDLRNDIPSLRDKNIAKFTLGVTRMYFDRQITDARTISNLNSTLKLLSAHLNEYDRNLNGLSAQELISMFEQTRNDNMENEKNEINSMQFSGESRYQIIPINSFKEAKQYYEYTNPNNRWCLTHMENMFETYTSDGINQVYFCLRDDFKSVPYKVGEGCPLDDYGLSMLSVIVNGNGELAYCTTRWNHENGGNDSAMTAREISNVVGVNFYQVFKPNNKWNTILSDAMERVRNGESPEEVFDGVGNFHGGFAVVYLNGKCNFINENGKILSPNQWFDWVYSFDEGFAKVKLREKYNYINQKGELINPNQWFDDVGEFYEGVARVKVEGKGYNLINENGELIYPNQWFDYVDSFYEGFAAVYLKGQGSNFIKQNGKIAFPNQWFDVVGSFREGFAAVYLDKQGWNLINQNGDILSPNQWFDGVNSFDEGVAKVKLNGAYYYINGEGELYDMNKNFIKNLRESVSGRRIDMIIESTLRKYLRK